MKEKKMNVQDVSHNSAMKNMGFFESQRQQVINFDEKEIKEMIRLLEKNRKPITIESLEEIERFSCKSY
jgi:hypothetical protein